MQQDNSAGTGKADQDADADDTHCAKQDTSQKMNLMRDFEVLTVVGRGGFGKVMQVRQRATGGIFAVKTMRKAHVVNKNDIHGVRTERSVLMRIRHPFIVRLCWAFHSVEKLYLVMDYVNGGTLFHWMREMGLFTETQARFFAAELLLAIEHLHSNNINHRDLKPENVLLTGADPAGHVVLTDFGCAKEWRDETEAGQPIPGDAVRTGQLSRSMVGTEAYMAPEVISRQEHGVSVDMWSYGVLLFEMMTSDLPFYHKNEKKMKDQICAAKPKYPRTLVWSISIACSEH